MLVLKDVEVSRSQTATALQLRSAGLEWGQSSLCAEADAEGKESDLQRIVRSGADKSWAQGERPRKSSKGQ